MLSPEQLHELDLYELMNDGYVVGNMWGLVRRNVEGLRLLLAKKRYEKFLKEFHKMASMIGYELHEDTKKKLNLKNPDFSLNAYTVMVGLEMGNSESLKDPETVLRNMGADEEFILEARTGFGW